MREPTKSERLLLVVFAAMIMVFLGLLLRGWLQRAMSQQQSQQEVLREQLVELRRWQGEKQIWEERGRWLAGNPLPAWEQENSDASFVQDLQRSVAASGIEILSQRLAENLTAPGFESVSVQLVVRASTEELVRWLHDLQQPGKFLAVNQLNIRADGDGENLRAEMQLTRFYRVVDAQALLEETPLMQEPTPAVMPDSEGMPGPVPEIAPESGQETAPPPIPAPPAGEDLDLVPLTPSQPAPELPGEAPLPSPPAESIDEEEELPPNPVLPFDDVFDPGNPDEPVSSPAPEVFDLLPVPATP